MMVIGRALMADPRLMLLDEPSLGLAPLAVQEIYQIIKRINEERGVSMLLVEQNVKAALGIADYGYVMENGRIVLTGPAERLRDNEDVKEFYMGISSSGSQEELPRGQALPPEEEVAVLKTPAVEIDMTELDTWPKSAAAQRRPVRRRRRGHALQALRYLAVV